MRYWINIFKLHIHFAIGQLLDRVEIGVELPFTNKLKWNYPYGIRIYLLFIGIEIEYV